MSAYDVKSTNMGEEKDEILEYGSPLSEEETEKKVQGDSKDGRRKTTNRITIDVTEIIEGKRDKKTVQRLDFQIAKPKEKLKIEDGGGDKLGDIARSNHHIGRMKAPDLKPLHKILFDRPGAVATMRKNMRLFNGFPFEVDSDLYIKKQKMLLKLTNAKLRTICKVLDLESGGVQSVLVERILTFLMAPKITGKPVMSRKKKKSKKRISTKDSKGKTKAKAKSASSSPRKAKAESKSKAIVTDSSSDDDEEEDKPGVECEGLEAEKKGGKAAKKKEETSDEDTDNSDDEEEGPKSKPTAKGKTTAQKSTPVKQRTMKKTAPLKKMKEEISDSESGSDSDKDDEDEKDSEIEVQKPKKKQATKRVAPTKSAAKTKKADSSSNRQKKPSKRDDDSSDDDVPLIKMIKRPPSDEQLKETLKCMLKDANLEEMTMKQICQKVYDTYPEYDLTSRKDVIKQTVKMLIS